METSRIIWCSPRSLLGLIFFSLLSFYPLNAKEIFNVSSCYPSSNFDYGAVKTVSFFFSGTNDIDIDAMIQSIAKKKADVVITGKTSIEGEALSPSLSTYVIVEKKIKEKAWLVRIDSDVSGVATKALAKDGETYRGSIPTSGQVMVFVGSTDIKEIEQAITTYLQNLADKIIDGSKTKPKFFVVH